jgi:hypothetical protein
MQQHRPGSAGGYVPRQAVTCPALIVFAILGRPIVGRTMQGAINR